MISKEERISKLNEIKELLKVYLPNENGEFSKVMNGLKKGLEQTDNLYKTITNEIGICTFLDNIELKQDIILELFNSEEQDSNYKKAIVLIDNLYEEFTKIKNEDMIKYIDEEIISIYDDLQEIKFTLEEILEVYYFDLVVKKIEESVGYIDDIIIKENLL